MVVIKSLMDTIIDTGMLGVESRVLTTSIIWDDTFITSEVEGMSVPELIAENIISFSSTDWNDPSKFDSITAKWINCTDLVSDYNYNQDSSMPISQLSVSVPEKWDTNIVSRLFREMRVIVIQEKYSSQEYITEGEVTTLVPYETEWKNICFCISDGYKEPWNTKGHTYVVNAKGVLKLANLDIVGSNTGYLTQNPDVIGIGTAANKFQMTNIYTEDAVFVFAIPATNGAIYPNWSAKPSAQFWIYINNTYYPIAIANNAVTVSYGEGILRIGKIYCEADIGDNSNYASGLGLAVGVPPVIKCALFRTLLTNETEEAYELHSPPLVLPPDIVEKTLTGVNLNTREITFSGLVLGIPNGAVATPVNLSIVIKDTTKSYPVRIVSVSGTVVTFGLTVIDSTLTIGSVIVIGKSNSARDTFSNLFVQAGFRAGSNLTQEPFLIYPAELPVMQGNSVDITLPPAVYKDTDDITIVGILSKLVSGGYLPPNWGIREYPCGAIKLTNALQLNIDDPETIPIKTLFPQIEMIHDDLRLATKVIARGIKRLQDDVCLYQNTTLSENWGTDGWLPDWNNKPAVLADTFPIGEYTTFMPDLTLLKNPTRAASVLVIEQTPWAIRYKNGEPLWQLGGTAAAAIYNKAEPFRNKIFLDISCTKSQIEKIVLFHPNSTALYTTYKTAMKAEFPQILEFHYKTEEGDFVKFATVECKLTDIETTVTNFDVMPVITDTIRIVCQSPYIKYNRRAVGDRILCAIFLYNIKIFQGGEIRQEAELGVTAPYNTARWVVERKRIRQRTFILPEAAVWAQDNETVASLALLWLEEKLKNYASISISCIRPDVQLFDTISFTLPTGKSASYLVTGISRDNTHVIKITCINYREEYFTDAWPPLEE